MAELPSMLAVVWGIASVTLAIDATFHAGAGSLCQTPWASACRAGANVGSAAPRCATVGLFPELVTVACSA